MADAHHHTRLATVDAAAVRARLTRGVAALLVVLSVFGALLVAGTTPLGAEVSAVGWVAISVAAWVATAVPLRVRFGRNSLDVTAIDAVIAAGLWLVPADDLVLAVVMGAALHLLLVQRARGHVLLVNLSLVALHSVVASLVVRVLVPTGTAEVLVGPTLVATATGAVVSALIVLLLAVLDEGESALVTTYGVVATHLGLALTAGASGALTADIVLRGGAAWWAPGLPLLLALVAASGFGRERARAAGLRGAIDATRTIHDADGPVDALRTMVREIAERFEATGAELHRLPKAGGSPARFTTGEVDDVPMLFVRESQEPDRAELLPPGRLRRPLAGWGMSIRVTVPNGDTVRVRVLRRPGLARPFTRNDLELFEAMCRAAIISFETSQMHETLARLEELDEMKTAFLTAVSHDLRTPLAVVLGGVLTLVEHEARLTVEQRSLLLTRMASQGRRLDQMLLDLLDIDRLQRGVIEPKREEVDITAEVATTVEAVSSASHPVRVSTQSVIGLVDRGHINRIIENLVRNAIKYTPAGTPIWVDVRRDATGAQLIVSDAGPGVPEEQRRAIFGAFVRGDDAHPSPGTGVGLDLVRRLAELHGGRAWVDERPGGGARFWVTLPNSVVAARSAV